jgi:hypothetical protein
LQNTKPSLSNPWGGRLLMIGLLCLLLTLIFDFLFYQHPIGWTLGLFGMLLCLAIVTRNGPIGWRWTPAPLVVGTLLVMLTMVLHPGVLSAVLGLLGLTTIAIAGRCGWTSQVGLWLRRWGSFWFAGIFRAIGDLRFVRRLVNRRQWNPKLRFGLWLLPILFGGIFVVLLISANPLMQHGLQTSINWIGDQLANLTWRPDLNRIMIWLAVAAGSWALLHARPIRIWPAIPSHIEVHRKPLPALPTEIVVRSLLIFNLIFAVQTVLDLLYLYGGAALPEAMTYAQYARRGAYPLVSTALLAGLFVLVMFRPGGAAQRSVWARRLVGLWVLQNLLLIGSAAWRLNLYVEAYTLTRWRVAAAVWMVLVALGFGWLIWRVLAGHTNSWLLQRITVTAAVVLGLLCLISVDERIAMYNVQHCKQVGADGPDIDIAYLERLGPAALPAMHWLSQNREAGLASDPTLNEAIRRQTAKLDKKMEDWRGWTWYRSRWAGESSAMELGLVDAKR